ncbi:hypothetical protein CLCR_10810 [Cladophialophora carrionii]|uniref:Uncharacterized protein n=1 Tax=Cladophialophora carrionii TaxID=86049 RepID=A0A1C1CW96_9EURO|nr:hypothetical protein CLCR_10810 [Cladophialophora carrionii]
MSQAKSQTTIRELLVIKEDMAQEDSTPITDNNNNGAFLAGIPMSRYFTAWAARSYPGLYPSQIRLLDEDWPRESLNARPLILPQYLIPASWDSSILGTLFEAMAVRREDRAQLVTLDQILLTVGDKWPNAVAADVTTKLRERAVVVLRRFQGVPGLPIREYFALRLSVYQATRIALRHSSGVLVRLQSYQIQIGDTDFNYSDAR